MNECRNLLATDLDHILRETASEVWESFRDARIFVTGGTGFFGCWLLHSLTWANDKLGLKASAVVLTRDPAAFETREPDLASHPAISLLRGDVRTFDFPPGAFSHVIHAATPASAQLIRENPLEMLQIIIDGTRRTLEFARRSGSRRFLLTSSGAVYGRQPEHISHIPEEYDGAPDPLLPGSAYGEGKRAAEHLCCLYAQTHEIQAAIARCFAFVGPYLPLDRHFAVGNFIRDALGGGPIRVTGDGTPVRSYLYAADLATWLWTILARGESCRAYNVGSDREVTIAELAHTVAACVEPKASVDIKQAPSSAARVERYVPSIEAARSRLGLRVSINLTEAIRNSIVYHVRRATCTRDA